MSNKTFEISKYEKHTRHLIAFLTNERALAIQQAEIYIRERQREKALGLAYEKAEALLSEISEKVSSPERSWTHMLKQTIELEKALELAREMELERDIKEALELRRDKQLAREQEWVRKLKMILYPLQSEIKALELSIEVPEDASPDEIRNIVIEAVLHADSMHRSRGGSGLKIDLLEFFAESLVPVGGK